MTIGSAGRSVLFGGKTKIAAPHLLNGLMAKAPSRAAPDARSTCLKGIQPAGYLLAFLQLQPRHPVRRETRRKTAADTRRTLDIELRLMTTERMLDDGQPEPGATGVA